MVMITMAAPICGKIPKAMEIAASTSAIPKKRVTAGDRPTLFPLSTGWAAWLFPLEKNTIATIIRSSKSEMGIKQPASIIV